ncbi:MAG: hypothetical protein WCI04_02815 [archaeon]
MASITRFVTLLVSLLFLATFSIALCGDLVIDLGEQCDGTNINGLNCEKLDRGYISGVLICTSDCAIDMSNCKVADSIQTDVVDANSLPNEPNLVDGAGSQAGGSITPNTLSSGSNSIEEIGDQETGISDENLNANSENALSESMGLEKVLQYFNPKQYSKDSSNINYLAEILCIVLAIWAILLVIAALNLRKGRKRK